MTETEVGDFRKVVRVGVGPYGSLFCRIEWKDGRLSICGVEGPKANGDCNGSAGQCVDAVGNIKEYAPGWDSETAKRFRETWDRWHLNDMRAGCQHQRSVDVGGRKVEVVEYWLTDAARAIRKTAERKATEAAVNGVVSPLDEREKALLRLDSAYGTINQTPDADSPLSGCYEVRKREMKAIGWVYPSEHPEGMLLRPCEVCGYKYGSAWLKEEVPGGVLDFLRSLPDTDRKPAWV